MPSPRWDAEKVKAQETLIRDWNPEARPTHCANCLHALVSGVPEDPEVRCARGHGPAHPKQLWVLIRPMRPDQFRRADLCPDFESMSDDVERTA